MFVVQNALAYYGKAQNKSPKIFQRFVPVCPKDSFDLRVRPLPAILVHHRQDSGLKIFLNDGTSKILTIFGIRAVLR